MTNRTKESETVPISISHLEMLLKIDMACDVSDSQKNLNHRSIDGADNILKEQFRR